MRQKTVWSQASTLDANCLAIPFPLNSLDTHRSCIYQQLGSFTGSKVLSIGYGFPAMYGKDMTYPTIPSISATSDPSGHPFILLTKLSSPS